MNMSHQMKQNNPKFTSVGATNVASAIDRKPRKKNKRVFLLVVKPTLRFRKQKVQKMLGHLKREQRRAKARRRVDVEKDQAEDEVQRRGCCHGVVVGFHKVAHVWDKFLTRIGSRLSNLVDYLKGMVPVFALMGLSLCCAGALFGIENFAPIRLDVLGSGGCLANTSYWTVLNFINSLSTTVGYGTNYPCTDYGRVFVIVYVIISIPLNVIVLDHIGKMVLRILHLIWPPILRLTVWLLKLRYRLYVKNYPCQKFFGKKKPEAQANGHLVVKQKVRALRKKDPESLPFTLGLMVAFLWVGITATYFSYSENWTFFSAVYFTFISLTTVGLGDFAPTKMPLTIPNYFYIFIGLAILSTCINIMQENIDNMIAKIQEQIRENYKQQLLAQQQQEEEEAAAAEAEEAAARLAEKRRRGKKGGHDTPGTAAGKHTHSKTKGPDSKPATAKGEVSKKDNVPKWVSALMSDKQMGQLNEMAAQAASMKSRGVQVSQGYVPKIFDTKNVGTDEITYATTGTQMKPIVVSTSDFAAQVDTRQKPSKAKTKGRATQTSEKVTNAIGVQVVPAKPKPPAPEKKVDMRNWKR